MKEKHDTYVTDMTIFLPSYYLLYLWMLKAKCINMFRKIFNRYWYIYDNHKINEEKKPYMALKWTF